MPSASTAITVSENAGLFASTRIAKRASFSPSRSASSHHGRHTDRAASVVSVMLPKSLIEALRAASRSAPSAIRSSVAIARCARISS
jgi:hypothetical protein